MKTDSAQANIFGSQRVAMTVTGTLSYPYSDHLGSASLTTDADGNVTAEMRYYPYGETRWSAGTMATDRRFTGQREESYAQLYDFQARYYDGRLGRFLQADTIVPDPANPQSLNRFSYTLGNPLRYTDPSGHMYQPALILGEPESPVVSPLTEFYGLAWEYDDDAPFDARNQAGRDELWAWFDTHPDYNPDTDPVMDNPGYYGIHWQPAMTDVQAFYNEWQWKNSDQPHRNVGLLLATDTALGAFYIVRDLDSGDAGIWATWVGPKLPDPSQPIPLGLTEWVGWELRGRNYWNESMKASLYPHPPDTAHPTPHWDYGSRLSRQRFWVFLDGRMQMK